jgi:hypothetical protein
MAASANHDEACPLALPNERDTWGATADDPQQPGGWPVTERPTDRSALELLGLALEIRKPQGRPPEGRRLPPRGDDDERRVHHLACARGDTKRFDRIV